jgi:RNA polymerase sigma factor (sigma-70 family)
MPEPPAVRYVKAAAGPDPGGPADAELLRRFAETRDQAAFELLVWRHAGMVQAAARAVLRDRHLAEDAAQAAFLALARHAGRVRANPSGWLYRTARRAALRLRRAGSVSDRRTQPPATGALLPVAVELRSLTLPARPDADDLAVLHDELARLPDRYRLPVLLCLAEGLTHPQAAARLGWPVGTVAGRLSRAKALLRDRLARRGVTAGLGLLAVEAVGGGWVLSTASAAVGYAAGGVAGVSPSVILLAKGLVPTMSVTKWAAGVLLAAGVGVGGLAAVAQRPAVPGPPLAVEPTKPNPGIPEVPRRAADYAQRQRSMKALRRIAFAAHAFHDAQGYYPADYRGNSGKPFLSWRVALLPFLHKSPFGDEKADEARFAALYKRFNLDEPWDGPTNKPLLAEMPDVYRLGFQPENATDTYYQGFSGPGAAFEPGQRLGVGHFNDGTSNTLMVAEVGPPVPWTRPGDVEYDPAKPFPAVRWPFTNVIHTAFADASFRHWAPTLPELTLRQFISRGDGEVIALDRSMQPRFVAETPDEKAAVSKLVATARARLAEIDKLLPSVASQDDAENLDERLKAIADDLKPPANK